MPACLPAGEGGLDQCSGAGHCEALPQVGGCMDCPTPRGWGRCVGGWGWGLRDCVVVDGSKKDEAQTALASELGSTARLCAAAPAVIVAAPCCMQFTGQRPGRLHHKLTTAHHTYQPLTGQFLCLTAAEGCSRRQFSHTTQFSHTVCASSVSAQLLPLG